MQIIIIITILTSLLTSCSFLSGKKEATFPIYGNYCGPLHPISGATPINAIDQVDSACESHDLCYEINGYFDAECDDELITKLTTIKTKTAQEEAARRLIIAYFEKIREL